MENVEKLGLLGTFILHSIWGGGGGGGGGILLWT